MIKDCFARLSRSSLSVKHLLFGIVLTLGSSFTLGAPQGSPWGADYFPNINLVNQDGKNVHFYNDLIKDKVVVINFIFTNCKLSCSLETARLRHLQTLLGDRVGRDVFIYSITIDPAHDTPAVLKQYAEKFGVGPGWQFFTGKEADITLLRQKLGLLSPQDPADQLENHNLSVLIGNEATGRWTKRSLGDNPQVLVNLIGYQMQNKRIPRQEQKSYAAAREIRGYSPRGEYLFNTRCSSCHTIGAGHGLGPDLLQVTSQRDRDWLFRWIKEPDVVLAEKDPIALALYQKFKELPMPNLQLSDGEVAALIDYLEKQSRFITKSNESKWLLISGEKRK
ncbi:SCO family protein [Nitrosomonas sp. Is37]|uniref:SCO family protein n=1 Tax=Nitrosomonas sp. Is37 TaxID=3080535 RepID=UPI00294B263F|nr:SCO family protein [Nitrosomonas sp. Is37]MDV6343321.1 SCO family protein [Nitrosomonas sp. Is37]